MRQFIERLLQTVDPPNPERAEQLWVEYRTGGPKADTAFATLMAWYGGPIYRRIWGFVRSDAAEDVFQDVLVRLHRRRQRFTDFEHALRWLRGVAVTQSLNARRGNVRRTKREHARNAAGGTATSEVETVELAEALRAALARLPEREREAVALVYFEGMTRQNGATALGVHRDTLTKLLDTALGRLKSALAATAIGAVLTTAGVESALAANPGLPIARLTVLAEAAWVNARSSGFTWPPARKLVPLILVGGLMAVAAAVTLSWSGFMTRSPAPARPQLTQLEPREVPAADFVSAHAIGTPGEYSSSEDVAVDAAGNSYVTGMFYGTVDFDPANDRPGGADVVQSAGGGDVFVAKYAPNGTLAWVTRMGGDFAHPNPAVSGYATDVGRELVIDGSGSVFVVGEFRGTANFGPTTLTSVGGNDAFVAKLDQNGTVLWANRWGAASGDIGRGVGIDATGNVYALGSRLTSPPGAAGNGYDILKFSPTGAAVWAKWISTGSQPTNGGLAVDAAGNTFVAGKFQGSVDFDPGSRTRYTSSGPSFSGFVLKLTSVGDYGWVAPFVGQGSGTSAGYSNAASITLDGGGNVIVGGYYKNSVDFKPGSGTTTLPTGGGAFITKLTAGGSLVWAKALEGGGSTFVNCLAVNSAGSIFATGSLTGTVDFDPGAGTQSKSSAGGNDAFVVKLTSAGEFGWAETFGGAGDDIGSGAAVHTDGTFSFVGRYTGTVDFDPDPSDTFNLPDNASRSGFLVKLRSN